MLTNEQHRNFRQQLWNVLHRDMGRVGHAVNFLRVIIILVSVAILPLELLPPTSTYHWVLLLLEIVTTTIFTVEYAAMVYAAPNRWRYIFSFFGLVDLLSILPFYIGLVGTQYIRAIRLLRLLKLGEIEAAAAEEDARDRIRQIGLGPDEHLEHVVTRHPFYLIVGCIPPLLAIIGGLLLLFFTPANAVTGTVAASLFLFALIFVWKTWLDYSYDAIFITSDRLIFQEQHLLGRSINQVHYHAIANVKPYYPSFLSYIFRYGNLIIETPAAETGQIVLKTVSQHEKAAHVIMHKSMQRNGGARTAPLSGSAAPRAD